MASHKMWRKEVQGFSNGSVRTGAGALGHFLAPSIDQPGFGVQGGESELVQCPQLEAEANRSEDWAVPCPADEGPSTRLAYLSLSSTDFFSRLYT